MRFSPLVLGIASVTLLASNVAASAVAGPAAADVDVSKGAEVIPLDSKEADAIRESDKSPKFAPKDNTYAEDFDKSSTFQKSEPKLSDQKVDVPDTELDSKAKQPKNAKPVATKEDAPVVVNDYDPNNMGVSSEGKTQKSEHLQKTDKTAAGDAAGLDSEDIPSVGAVPTKEDSESVSGSSSTPGSAPPVGGASAVDSKLDADTKSSTTETAHTPIEKLKSVPEKDTLHALIVSFSMTVMSEIGDKTFLIAAIMAMRHNRLTVLSAAFSALVVMTVLSGVIGHTLPTLLSRRMSAFLAGCLFLFFGFNLLREGMQMDKDQHVDEELEEVEAEINAAEATLHGDDLEMGLGEKGIKRSASIPRISQDGLDNVAGDASLYRPRPRRANAGAMATAISVWNGVVDGLGNLAGLVLSPVWAQIFAMTFFAEWGDRSQIATIAMAAGSDYWFVIIGSIFGHFICTGSAVIGGKLLATRITLKNITLGGAFLFFFFAIIYFYESFHD